MQGVRILLAESLHTQLQRPRLIARTACSAFISSTAMVAARLSRPGSRRISSACRRVRRSLSARQRASSWASFRRSAALMPGSWGAAAVALLPLVDRRGLLLVLPVPVLRVRVAMALLGWFWLLPGLLQKPGHQPAAGHEPSDSADRDGAAGGALQLAGKGEGLVSRDQPHLLDGLAAPAQELDSTGSAAALAGARLIAVNHKQADFTDGALGNGHGWGGAENIDQTPRRRLLARGEHRKPCVSPGLWEPKGHAAEGCSRRPASQFPVATVQVPC